MAAPPLPQSPANQQQPQQQQPRTTTPNASIASPKSPQSPGSQTLEQQRIALLLSINIDLLTEVNNLQQSGQGGAISAQQQMSLKNAGQPDKLASEEYIQCLRRVQANLAYMMPKAQPGQHENSKVPPGPAHMTPPRHMVAQLGDKYRQLKELFPGWQGMEHRMSQGGSAQSPTPNAQAQAQAQAQMANGVNNNMSA